jgi:hypothetical protein
VPTGKGREEVRSFFFPLSFLFVCLAFLWIEKKRKQHLFWWRSLLFIPYALS